MTKTLADLTPAKRAQCVGMWCMFTVARETYKGIIIEVKEVSVEGVAHVVAPERTGLPSHLVLGRYFDEVTLLPDLPRAWRADGTPLDTCWESITTQPHPRGSWNNNPENPEYFDVAPGTHMRRRVGEWEPC